MSRHRWIAVSLPMLFAWVLMWGTARTSAQQEPKKLEWSHAFDLATRKVGEADFSDKTQKFGVEVFRDDNNGLGIYVSEAGGLAIAPSSPSGTKLPLSPSKQPDWYTGLDLPVRLADQKEFTKDSKVFSLEVFKDPNVENWLYISAEKANLAVVPIKTRPTGSAKAPKHLAGFSLTSRKGGVKSWDGATKYDVECYQDVNTGCLIYICSQTGSIAVTTDSPTLKAESPAPDWLHGLDLGCRKPEETSFTPGTRKIGVEVYRDEGAGQLLFLSETGTLAVAPAPRDLKVPTADVKDPTWSHGLNVKCRAYGEKEFTEKTRVFGIEIFREENLGITLAINDLGNLSAR